MRVVGFVGPSGTGKSFRAMNVARKNKLQYVIDDGLLICDNRIVAGHSAKKEHSKLEAVIAALFLREPRAEEMKEAIEKNSPESILILGTSEKMVHRIAENLGLPKVESFINITDVASEKEILQASESRNQEGKHVIPVPTFEIRQDFSGYFVEALRTLGITKRNTEKSIVRPTFSYLGDYNISKKVLVDISKYEAGRVRGVGEVSSCIVINMRDGIEIYIELSMKYGINITKCSDKVIKSVANAIENYTNINVRKVNVNVKKLIVEKDWIPKFSLNK